MRPSNDSLRSLTSLATLAAGFHETAAIRAPSTGEPLVDLPLAGPADLDAALRIARSAQPPWAAMPTRKRCAILKRFRGLLLDRSELLLDIVQLETGKARGHAFEELADVALVTGYYCRVAPRVLARRRRRGAVPGLTRTVELRHPHGVVGMIVPWNYPLALAVSDSVPALLAGNVVIVKPDPQTTCTVLAALDLLLKAGLPAGVFQVVPGDGPVAGAGLVDRVDYMSFTGSTATGRAVGLQAAARLIGCSLELGGKNPMIVRADADLARAAAGAVRGSFANAGQLCIGTERIYVQRDALDAFLSALVEKTRGLRLGSRLDYDADMGSLTTEHQLQKVEEHVRDAVEKGAVVHTGGRARPDIGPLFYEPTVLTSVTPDMSLHSAETFGPVVAVYPYVSDDEAVALANESCFGLNASIWSGDLSAALRMARRIDTGTVNVNESYSAAWGSVDSPIGGRKDSGTGRRHGVEGLLRFTESQTVAVQKGMPLDLSTGWLEKETARKAAVGAIRRFRPGAS